MRTYTAAEAAAMTGRGERTIRRMIDRGQLKAQKAPNGNWLIKESDLPQTKIDPLAAELAVLHTQIAELRREIEQLKDLRTTAQATRLYALPAISETLHSSIVESNTTDARLSAFAQNHGVPRRTAADHAALGRIPTERRIQPGRPDERPYWLTLEQQRAAVAFWRANYAGFKSCPRCPHE